MSVSIIKFERKENEAVTPCEHTHMNIDRVNKTITCRDCNEPTNPFDGLMDYSDALDDHKESLDAYRDRLDVYRKSLEQDAARNQIVARRLENRKRTKCHHCDKITNINIKEPRLSDINAEVAKGASLVESRY